MTDYEKELIRIVKEKIQWYSKRNIGINYVLDWLDDIIYNSPNYCSNEYYSELFKMQYTLLNGK